MKQSHLALICGCVLFIILAISWCKPGPQPPAASPKPPVQLSPQPPLQAPGATTNPVSPAAQVTAAPTAQSPAPDFRKVAERVGPAVILVSVFDEPGKLLTTKTGFFVAEDGKFVTNWRAIVGAAHAVAKSADGKIRNVTGVLTSSVELDLAVLRAETKTGVPFLQLSKASELQTGAFGAVIGSPLARRPQPLLTATISARRSDPRGDQLETSNPISNDAEGAPVVDENGEVLGIVTPKHEQGATGTVVRSASSLDSLLAQIKPNTKAHWAAAKTESPSPEASPAVQATPDNRKSKLTYNPAPKYPPEARVSRISGSGRFRITFSTEGEARDVQVIQSTGKSVLDQAAADSLRQWKAEPGREWSVVVPITFKP